MMIGKRGGDHRLGSIHGFVPSTGDENTIPVRAVRAPAYNTLAVSTPRFGDGWRWCGRNGARSIRRVATKIAPPRKLIPESLPSKPPWWSLPLNHETSGQQARLSPGTLDTQRTPFHLEVSVYRKVA